MATPIARSSTERCDVRTVARTAFALATLALTGTACRHSPARSTAESYSNPHAADSIGSVRQMYDGTLSPTLAVNTFRNIDRLFPTRIIRHGTTVMPLPAAATPLGDVRFSSAGETLSMDTYMARNRVTGLLVLKNGRIALERYREGNSERTRWMSMSVAKSITSTLIGAAIRDGAIRSLDDAVTRYVPALQSSAYDGVTIRQLLMMSSGVRWNETYTDPTSDRRRLLEVQIAQRPGTAVALMASLPRAAPPGSVNTYSTGETQIAGEVVRGATGKSLAEYLGEKIWRRVGMESDASWWLDSPDGHEIGGSGFSATLRDYARFGAFVLRNGVVGTDSVLPPGWRDLAGSPKTLRDGTPLNYGFMWWPSAAPVGSPNHQSFAAEGIFGQTIYINPREQVVIVQWCAQTRPTGGEVVPSEEFFAAVVRALR